MAEVLTMREVMDRWNALKALPADHPESLTGYERNSDDDGWNIYWGGYGYWIQDADLKTEKDLFRFIDHVGQKSWKGMTGQRLSKFIMDCVCRI